MKNESLFFVYLRLWKSFTSADLSSGKSFNSLKTSRHLRDTRNTRNISSSRVILQNRSRNPPNDLPFTNLPPTPPTLETSFYKRPLPNNLHSFSSPIGKALFKEALESNGMENYWTLAEQFNTQSEPACIFLF